MGGGCKRGRWEMPGLKDGYLIGILGTSDATNAKYECGCFVVNDVRGPRMRWEKQP